MGTYNGILTLVTTKALTRSLVFIVLISLHKPIVGISILVLRNVAIAIQYQLTISIRSALLSSRPSRSAEELRVSQSRRTTHQVLLKCVAWISASAVSSANVSMSSMYIVDVMEYAKRLPNVTFSGCFDAIGITSIQPIHRD